MGMLFILSFLTVDGSATELSPQGPLGPGAQPEGSRGRPLSPGHGEAWPREQLLGRLSPGTVTPLQLLENLWLLRPPGEEEGMSGPQKCGNEPRTEAPFPWNRKEQQQLKHSLYQEPLILMDGRHFCSNKNRFNNQTAKLLFF